MGLSVRMYCYGPEGHLYAVPTSVTSALIGIGDGEGAVAIPRFANCTVRFANFVVELHARKPVAISTESYEVFRFDGHGVADSGRYRQEMLEKLESLGGSKVAPGVVDARVVFASRGRGWTATHAEKVELQQAALGRVKVPRLPGVEMRTHAAYTL